MCAAGSIEACAARGRQSGLVSIVRKLSRETLLGRLEVLEEAAAWWGFLHLGGTKWAHRRSDDMSTNPKSDTPDAQPSNTVKDPDDWTTGDETMTGAQASYLKTLSEEAGEPFDPGLSKAEASKRIDSLQGKTGRGKDH